MSYLVPASLDEALAAISAGSSTVLAGGTDVFPGPAKARQAMVDISRLAAVRGIRSTAECWWIGGATTWSEILAAELPPAFDGLKAAAREVGSVQIQNAGTIAGNLCNASPAADGAPPLLTLEARVQLASAQGARELPLEDFLLGPRQTARRSDEILTGVVMPHQPQAQSAFLKLGSRTYLVISIAMVAVCLTLRADGRIARAQVAVGASGPVAMRMRRLEAQLEGSLPAEAKVRPEDLDLAPIDDVRGSAAYRRDAAAELATRAIAQAAHG